MDQIELLRVPCVKISQPIGDFFVCAINSRDLTKITYVDVRRMADERAIDSYLGIQRPLDKKRVKEISQYTRTADACFPTAVILSIPGKCAEYDEATRELILRSHPKDIAMENDIDLPFEQIAEIIDGQHRIAGLQDFTGPEFTVNVSVFVDIDVSMEAYLFSTVNLAQTKVSKSLVYDLYELAKKKSPQKLCHNIAVSLDKMEDSPLYTKIKRLGAASPLNSPMAITQAAFVQSLIPYLSKDAMLDRDIYMRDRVPPRAEGREKDKYIFRDFMIDNRDFELTDIIWNYFSAVRERWPVAWSNQDKGIMLSRTNGFSALMRFLKFAYLHLKARNEVPTQADFLEIFNRVKLADEDFNTEKFLPGTSGESLLLKTLKDETGLA